MNNRKVKILNTTVINDNNISNKSKKLNKKTFIFSVLVLLLFISIMIIPRNSYKSIIRKILAYAGIYTEEIKQVEIESNDYDDPGSFKITKSAKWQSTNKVQITFDVDSVIKTGDNYKDIILVLDNSGSMNGEKLTKAINDSKDLVNTLLSDNHNRVALITFNSTSSVLSTFSNNKETILELLDNISTEGSTNYNVALQNIDTVMTDYIKQDGTDVVALFLTDGYPNEGTPSEVAEYTVLKDKYPYLTINGVQYEMGKDIIDEITAISDNQFVADKTTLNNVLIEAGLNPDVYEKFIIEDYINTDYFNITSIDDIKTSIGTATIEDASGEKKVVWNLGDNTYVTGNSKTMTINLTLNDTLPSNKTFYPTNTKEIITYKLNGEEEQIITRTDTPVLTNKYSVIYDNNTPNGCVIENNIDSDEYLVYSTVSKSTNEITCTGYHFRGWKIDDEDDSDITHINENLFIMPGHDVIIRAEWSNQSITKSVDGTVNTHATLYKVLKDEAENGNLAKEYTGEHHDSFTEEPSQKIYHWYATNNSEGTQIQNKNNVIFADHCWQMIRTTDTGGVKMIYNGEALNGQCLNTRGTHIGYGERISQNLSSNYWYGTDYTYDSVNKVFTLSGTTEQTTWNATTGPELIGKYTCKLTSEDGSCSTLYLVDSDYTVSSAYVIPLNSNSNYSQFGSLQYNLYYYSLASVGYMRFTTHISHSREMASSENVLSTTSISTSYWYADSISYDSVANKYSLISPYKVSAVADYPTLVGKYTFRNSSQNYTAAGVYYIAGVSGNTIYYIYLGDSENHTLADFNYTYTYGDSYIDNGNGTYTINNPTTMNRSDWYTDFSNVGANKYVCKNAANNSCSDLWYIVETSNTFIKLYKTYKYSKSFNWDGSKYVLNNDTSISFWNISDSENQSSINNAHYTCWNEIGECTNLSYIYYISPTKIYYLFFSDGKGISDVKNEMLYNNDINIANSVIKIGVDAWYKKYLLYDYDNYIEDTIYCNNRSQRNADTNGWNPNGGMTNVYLQFKEYNGTRDLSCENIVDQFSISNNNAKLTYKVGLMSSPEMNLLNNNNARTSVKNYWLASPSYFSEDVAYGKVVTNVGSFTNTYLSAALGVRPAISLRPGIEYINGDGSMEHPYIIDTSDE